MRLKEALIVTGKGKFLDWTPVLVEKRSENLTKGGKAFLSITVRDRDCSVDAKLWDYDPKKHSMFEEGSAVDICGKVDSYQGNPQIILDGGKPCSLPISELVRSSRFDVDKMWAELSNIVESFNEPLTKFVAKEILLKHEKFIEAFKAAPAAKIVHNAWYGGLLEHVISLCRIAEPVILHYQTSYRKKISRDKVLFGLIMHDAAKIVEYDYTKPSFNLTGLGLLTNHIVLGPAWVYETANKYEEKSLDFKMERAHLMHVLAAHHGKAEWGSPVPPASIEALLVHHLDNLDSKMMHAIELVEEKPGEIKGFSSRSYFERSSYLV